MGDVSTQATDEPNLRTEPTDESKIAWIIERTNCLGPIIITQAKTSWL